MKLTSLRDNDSVQRQTNIQHETLKNRLRKDSSKRVFESKCFKVFTIFGHIPLIAIHPGFQCYSFQKYCVVSPHYDSTSSIARNLPPSPLADPYTFFKRSPRGAVVKCHLVNPGTSVRSKAFPVVVVVVVVVHHFQTSSPLNHLANQSQILCGASLERGNESL